MSFDPEFMNTPLRIAADDRPFSLVERGLDGLYDTYKGKANVRDAKKVRASAIGAFDVLRGRFMRGTARKKNDEYIGILLNIFKNKASRGARIHRHFLNLFGVISGAENGRSDSDISASHRNCILKISAHSHGQL